VSRHTHTKATYDVYAVFSAHVCHSCIHVHYCIIVYFSLYFQVFLFGVYKRYTQLMSIASPWNFPGIWHTGTCCPDIRYFTKYTSGITAYYGNSNISLD